MKNKKANCGIYEIRNTENNKVYLGSSQSLRKRKCTHLKDLNRGKHHCNHLQNSFKKYGIDKFEFKSIHRIEKISDKKLLKEVLLKWENYYLKEYILLDKNGKESIDHSRCYNSSPTPGSCLGIKYSHSKVTKEVVNITTGEIFSTITEASELYIINRSHISSVCKGRRRMAGGYEWRYIGEEDKKIYICRGEAWNNTLKSSQKKVINLDTEKIFDSITEAARFYNICRSKISDVCKGKRNKCGNYRWSYV